MKNIVTDKLSRPNILICMVDQLNGKFDQGPKLHAPHQPKIQSGPAKPPARYLSHVRAITITHVIYENAAEFAASIPTYAHHLNAITILGKMHYVGPDQLHGFETRTTTDIYPADFGWTPDTAAHWWTGLGQDVAEISNQMKYDAGGA